MSSQQSDVVSLWKPSIARHEFRTNPALKGVTTAGFCMGYLQTTVVILPSALANDFEQFCEFNSVACPLLSRSERGEVSAGPLAPASDIRTDIPKYCVNEFGVIAETPGDLTAHTWNDLVSFYVGCSFGFEGKLVQAGIPLKNITEKHGDGASMFETNLHCISVGPFASPLIVSMRAIPKDLVEKTLIITTAFEGLHGAPIHIGDPAVIGIDDLYNTEFGEPSDIGDLIPMFWACGRSGSIALRAAKLPLCFCHFPGSVFICDTTVDEYFKIHRPEHGDEQPRLVTLTDQPYLASVCSVSVATKVEQLAEISAASNSVDGKVDAQSTTDFLKISLRLSHAPIVVIGFLNEKESFLSETSTSECIQAMIALIKALEALNKKITIVTEHNAKLFEDSIEDNVAQGHLISKDGVPVVECAHDEKMNALLHKLYQGKIIPRLDTMIGMEAKKSLQPETKSDIKSGLVDTLFEEAEKHNGIVSIKIIADKTKTTADEAESVDSHTLITSSLKVAGCGLAAALCVLNMCAIHSRYMRRGIGKRPIFQAHQFILNTLEITLTRIMLLLSSDRWKYLHFAARRSFTHSPLHDIYGTMVHGSPLRKIKKIWTGVQRSEINNPLITSTPQEVSYL